MLSHKDFTRARSVWERALEVDHRDQAMWLKYADFEMKNKFIDHERNLLDRATVLLPRADRIWCKYINMEEMLGNYAGVRDIFERWMKWSPDQQWWLLYIKFELKSSIERARNLFYRFVDCHPNVSAWIQFAEFEMENKEIARARNCFERAVDKLADHDEEANELFLAFAEFEEKCNETERARCIYKYALDHIPKGRAEEICKKFVAFEKQHGDREGIDDAIVGKRRSEYEDEIRKNPLNYDCWFDYIRLLEESDWDKLKIEDVYERAVSNVPPAEEKHYWRRYIYLWINYALYEELDAQDIERTRDVYNLCLKTIPHEKLSFAKVWLMAAQFEIRQLNIDRARKFLGSAIGMAPKDKL